MSDAGAALRALRDGVGEAYDARSLHSDLDVVERRVKRARGARAVKSTVLALTLVAGGTLLAVQVVGGGTATPALTPSATPSGTETSAADAWPAWCSEATVVPGKPLGNLGGFEGWYNSTQDAPCDEWDQLVKDHPDTVWVNTTDNTMLEAYYRTSIDALGVYGTLGGDFKIPDPDATWPMGRLVLIDPTTGDVLQVEDPADYNYSPPS